MKKVIHLFTFILVIGFSQYGLAEERKSAYGIDYSEFTFNEIITDFMYKIEPKLIKFYDTLKLSVKDKKWALEGIASGLGINHMFRNLVTDIEATDPEATFVFTQLPKTEYSNLHLLAEYFRVKKSYKDKTGRELTKEEGESNLKLYKALFGKEHK